MENSLGAYFSLRQAVNFLACCQPEDIYPAFMNIHSPGPLEMHHQPRWVGPVKQHKSFTNMLSTTGNRVLRAQRPSDQFKI